MFSSLSIGDTLSIHPTTVAKKKSGEFGWEELTALAASIESNIGFSRVSVGNRFDEDWGWNSPISEAIELS
jgi:hypothetical protein